MPDAALRTLPLHLPPVFRPVAAPADVPAFAHALAIAAEEGAGTFVVGGDGDLIEAAIVLEPEEPLASARRLAALGLDALHAALAAEAPPGTAIAIAWPDTIRVGGAVVGGVRLASLPSPCGPDAVPDRLVLGLVVRLAAAGGPQPGSWTRGTALVEEGFEDVDPGTFVEGLAAQVLSRIDLWETEGFDRIGAGLALRLGAAAVGPGGDLVDRDGRTVAPAIDLAAPPGWLDPETGSPWL